MHNVFFTSVKMIHKYSVSCFQLKSFLSGLFFTKQNAHALRSVLSEEAIFLQTILFVGCKEDSGFKS